MKKEMGFTLVELLAVIVVLAIILIIAVPGVLGIIQQSKEKAQKQQRQMIEEAARLYVTTDSNVVWVGEDTKTTVVSLDMLKAKGYMDQKIMDPKTKKEITCTKTTVTRQGRKFDYQTEFCDQVNASPRLSSGMIPIVYDTAQAKWLKADMTNQGNSWYNYENRQWANMATVTEATRDAYKKANIGTEVKMSDINTMFVWIPRFKYKLWNVTGETPLTGNPNLAGDKMIDVVLENVMTPKSTGTQNGEWLTHPAFTFGGEELEGFWMAKFETGYKDATTTDEAKVNILDPSKVLIKPNAYSWRNISVYNSYRNASKMNQAGNAFGLDTGNDPHLMKNMEWGAMAYLTQSKYGKTGNPTYTGDNRQVIINNNKLFLTGCGAESQDAALSDTCNTYETPTGQAASTTGNITGIYDTSGGAWDATAGVMENSSGSGLLVSSSQFPQNELNTLGNGGKYIDVYAYGNDYYDRSRGHLGDATKEMGPFYNLQHAWYGDYAHFVTDASGWTWFVRGGSNDYGQLGGNLSFSGAYGMLDRIGSRIVLL